MKKIICSFLTLSTSAIFAQAGQKWASVGNSASSGDFVGTTNNVPLVFKANNVIGMSLGTNGVFKVNGLAGTGSRFLQTDAAGNLISFPMGNSTDVLFGNGTWGSLPAGATSWQLVGSNLISTAMGNIGIGTTSPQYKLEVIGDARISNNLYVGGGIVITDRLNAAESVTTTVLHADSIKMDASRAIYGDTRIEGDIDAKNKLTVTGNALFNGVLRSNQGFMFDNYNGFKLNSVTTGTTTTDYFMLGKSSGVPESICGNPNINQWMVNSSGGFISSQINPPSAPLVKASVNMFCAPWNGSGFIEVEGKNEAGNEQNALFVNYFCGRDVALCVNTGLTNGGGKVSVGNFLSAAQHVEIGGQQYGIAPNNAPAGNIALDMHVNTGKAIKIRTYAGNNAMFEIFNTGNGINKTTFFVDGNGRTQIGVKTPGTPHTDALLSVYGKVVATSCYIKTADWADYVFQPEYKMPTLYEIEKYYKVNMHLEGIPSEKEVLEKGVDVAEMNKLLLKKVEELTILMVQQQKEIDQLKLKLK